ncbi:glyoxalase superfamily protein [Mesorhizobium sp. ASY16-5R]|uniref:glyoxalase superfamily protein n=1 Tax=Mesorhizobium sp. ASY16-5R TaxID=3445772 RepID=UPI003FA0E596
MRNYRDAKAMAKAMREALAAADLTVSHSQALEIVAKQFGLASWNVLSAKIEGKETDAWRFEPPAPIIRIFDEARARDFYLGFLGMTLDWEHRFETTMPLYCQVSRGALKLHLSEHSGDASPGANMLVYMKGVEAWQKSLVAKDYKYNRPGLQRQDWGVECEVIAPFGNRIRFLEA